MKIEGLLRAKFIESFFLLLQPKSGILLSSRHKRSKQFFKFGNGFRVKGQYRTLKIEGLLRAKFIESFFLLQPKSGILENYKGAAKSALLNC